MAARVTSLAKWDATWTQFSRNDPQRLQAATLLEIADLGREQRVTNELLELNVQIAYRSSDLMQGILQEMAHLNDAAGRERRLKEILYQMTKLLGADRKVGIDPVELAFRSRLFLHTVREHGLTTTDLGDLNEKALYDKLVSSAAASLEGPPYKELKDFETVYGMFASGLEHDPGKSIKVPTAPTKPTLTLPDAPVLKLPDAPVLKLPSNPLEETFEAELALHRSAAMGCGGLLLIILVIGVLGVLGCRDRFGQGEEFRGQGALMVLVSGLALYYAYRWFRSSDPATASPEARADFERRKTEEAEERDKATREHKIRKQEHDVAVENAKAAFAELQTQYKMHNKAASAELETKYKAAFDEYQAQKKQAETTIRDLREEHRRVLADLASKINAFLDQHAGLQEFLPKVKMRAASGS
jgi:hypothetical protein